MAALVASILCLALNAFFVAAEFALVKVRATELEQGAKRGERRAVAARAVLSRLDRYLSVTQFGITVASLGLGWIGEPALERLGDHVALALTGEALGATGHVIVDVVGLATLTFFHLLLGELVPKFVAIQHSRATVLASAIPLRLVDAAFRPVLFVLEKAQRAVLRVLRIDPNVASEGTLSEDEIIGILAANAARSDVARDKQHIVERLMRFARRPLREIMVPRVDVVWLPRSATRAEALDLFDESGLSRILVGGASLDDVVGYLYVKDVFFDRRERGERSIEGLVRPVLFVPRTRDGLFALRAMQREGSSLAVVVDEFGGTSGIVTLEDLVEEIFGALRDELDEGDERMIVELAGARTWEVDARAKLSELRDAGIPVDEPDAAHDAPLGKVVVDRLGHVPRIGDVVTLAEGLVAEIVAASRRRVQRLRVRAV